MCLGVPMRIVEINYPAATAEARGVRRKIGLHLLPEGEVAPGDHVIVHVGFAIEKIEEKVADEIRRSLNEAVRAMDGEGSSA